MTNSRGRVFESRSSRPACLKAVCSATAVEKSARGKCAFRVPPPWTSADLRRCVRAKPWASA
eukprot:1005217-Alexandrium_andersonii.AAC.1